MNNGVPPQSCRITRTVKYFYFVSLSGAFCRLKNFPMRTRFLLGPAGSGKTFRCLAEIREDLKSSPEGLPLVLLAPKQATFQLERQLLAGPDLPRLRRGVHGARFSDPGHAPIHGSNSKNTG